MGYVAKLRKGAAELDLTNAAPYKLATFVPPTAVEVTSYAAGSSANRYGGAVAVGRRGANQAFSFTVHVMGDSSAEIEGAFDQLGAFLAGAGDEDDPLYFDFRPDNGIPFDPTWGQHGATRSLEIVEGRVHKSALYGSSKLKSVGTPNCLVDLTVKPYAIGKRQRLASAKGAIYEDAIGNASGRIRGTAIPPAITNLVTNPIFSHTTWNNDWTADAEVTATQNTDKRFVLFGSNSAKLVGIGSTAADHDYYIAVTCANTNNHVFSVYAKKPDSSAVTTADLSFSYDSNALTETYTAVGNGWYRVTASAAGVAAARSIMFRIGNYTTIYLDGAQVEEGAYATPLAYGDLLGCAWGGTAGDTTTTRTAARLMIAIADTISNGEGTIRMVFTPTEDQDYGANFLLFDTRDAGHATSLQLYFATADNTMRLTDGVNNADTGALTWTKRSPMVIHATWSAAGGLDLYINGASAASAATFTPPSIGADIYIGTNYSTATGAPGIFNGVAPFDRAASAAEVLADYNNVVQLARGGDGYGQRVEALPWIWTKDGDEIIDVYDDATHDNWCVIGGIDGDTPADTIIDLTHTSNGVIMSHLDWPTYLAVGDWFTDSGGTLSITTTGDHWLDVGGGLAGVYLDTDGEAYYGQTVCALASVLDAGTLLSVRLGATWYAHPGDAFYGEYKSIATADGTSKLFFFGTAGVLTPRARGENWVTPLQNWPQILPYSKRGTGTADITWDFYQVLFGNIWVIQGGGTRYVLRDNKVSNYTWNAGGSYWEGYTGMDAQGTRALEFVPQRYNHLVCIAGDLDANTDRTETTTINRAYVYPRWRTQ